MKTIRTKFLSLLLALVTILSLLPTAAFAASNTGSGLKITTNQAYWSTRLLANGTPYSYRPPLADGKLVCCMDSGLGYHYATPSYLNSFTWTSGTGADADAVLQSAVTNSGLSEMDAATVENVKWMMTYLNDCKESNVGQLFMAVQTYVWENQSYKGEPGGDGDAGGYERLSARSRQYLPKHFPSRWSSERRAFDLQRPDSPGHPAQRTAQRRVPPAFLWCPSAR